MSLDEAVMHGLGSQRVGIEAVTLEVRDLERALGFYTNRLGLTVHETDAAAATLGTGNAKFLHLVERPDKAAPDPHGAGLFHIAYRLPRRQDLGAALIHLERSDEARLGAADHGVSEALYLADPDGHGIEIYVDRPEASWPEQAGRIRFTTAPLDRPALRSAASEPWRAMPAGSDIGHLHLRVADLEASAGELARALHLRTRAALPGACFLAWGRYHHHVAINVWHSAGGTEDEGRVGLRAVRYRDGEHRGEGDTSALTHGIRWSAAAPV